MRKDFKRAGYLLTVLIFLLGIGALVISSVANYFSYNDSVVVIGEFISFVALIMLVVMCNGIRLTVCINELDLQGEPEAGRRFRGIIWLQGYVHFPDLSK